MAELPSLARRAGLEVEHFAPVARIGAVGSLEWRWLGEFFAGYLPKLAGTLLSESDVGAFHAEWRARTDDGASFCYAPVMADAVLRKR
jgi:hypothetical protein